MVIQEPPRSETSHDHPSGGLFLCSDMMPKLAGDIQRYSGQFFNTYHDLLRNAAGVVIQASWDANAETLSWDSACRLFKIDPAIPDTVTLGFSAQKHVEDEELRCDAEGNRFYGTGIYEWQLVQANDSGRKSVSFVTGGAALNNLQGSVFDQQGQRKHFEVDTDTLVDTWSTIGRLTTDPTFQEHVERLREARAEVVHEQGRLLLAKHTMPHRQFRIKDAEIQRRLAKQGFGRFSF